MIEQSSALERAVKYANGIVSGSIVASKYTVSSCRRFLADLKSQKKRAFEYRLDEKKAELAIGFIELLTHTKGKWAGKQIILEPWQVFIVVNIFGWVRKSDRRRRFREAYIEVPRKNGKSLLAACIAIYMLVADGEMGAEVYCGATSEKQAFEVFTPALSIIRQNEDLRDYYGIEAYKSVITVESLNAKLQPIIGNPPDGSSPSCAIVDEYHEHATPNLYDTMVTGMGAREQPLLFVITTAGSNLAGPCYDKRQHVIKVLNGVITQDDLFCVIYCADDADNWTDIAVWRKANPNYGVSVFEDFLKARLLEATQRTSRQNIIRCKHLNQWANAGTAWIDPLRWRACGDTNLSLSDFTGEPCIIGLDLASKIDIAAKILLFKRDGVYYVFGKYYLPSETVNIPENSHYAGWAKQGWLNVTSGGVTDFSTIQKDIIEDTKNYLVSEIAYDPWQATQLAQGLQAEGAQVVEYRNTVATMSEPMKELEGLIVQRRIMHNNDPVLAWMASNVIVQMDKKDNIFPRKERAENKIDGIIGLIMCIGRDILHNRDSSSIYEGEFGGL